MVRTTFEVMAISLLKFLFITTLFTIFATNTTNALMSTTIDTTVPLSSVRIDSITVYGTEFRFTLLLTQNQLALDPTLECSVFDLDPTPTTWTKIDNPSTSWLGVQYVEKGWLFEGFGSEITSAYFECTVNSPVPVLLYVTMDPTPDDKLAILMGGPYRKGGVFPYTYQTTNPETLSLLPYILSHQT